jgi:hypothetical protein
MEVIQSLIMNNPVSQKIISTSKKVLFKDNGEIATISKDVVKQIPNPITQSLFEVNKLSGLLLNSQVLTP